MVIVEAQQLFLKKSRIKEKCFGLRSIKNGLDASVGDIAASNEEGSSRRVDLVVVNMVPPMFRVTTPSCLAITSLTFKDSLSVGTYGVEDGRSGTAYSSSGCGSITPCV